MTNTDVLILGSGFGGSLLAVILARNGMRVSLVDRQKHPRFAIGESTTPLADTTLRQIARTYGIPELLPLCRWGSWKKTHPELICGRKRGFTYIRQFPGRDITAESFGSNRLLVAASRDDEHSDTHWLRSDIDRFLFQLARQSGVACFEETDVRLSRASGEWTATGLSGGCAIRLASPFVVDATGAAGGVLQFLNIGVLTHELRTNSRSVFAHFQNATPCERLLHNRGIDTSAFPFRCDDAAVHQVLDDGWMWQLRFDDDSLSAGFVVDQRSERNVTPTDAGTEWSRRLATYPFLAEQFRESRIIRPGDRLVHSPRLQRLSASGAGSDWAALPNTIGFIDPLHSTGIAHTLFGVARLAQILTDSVSPVERTNRLDWYSRTVISEIRMIDALVEGCYASLPSFRLWSAWSMLYFAAATSMEQDCEAGLGTSTTGFLRAGDRNFLQFVNEARQRLKDATDHPSESTEEVFESYLRTAVEPWNRVGLFDPAVNGLYTSTAASADA